jgi:hypothetical protein
VLFSTRIFTYRVSHFGLDNFLPKALMLKSCSGNTLTWGNVDYNKLAALAGNVDNGGVQCEGAGEHGKCELSIQFCYGPKCTLKE